MLIVTLYLYFLQKSLIQYQMMRHVDYCTKTFFIPAHVSLLIQFRAVQYELSAAIKIKPMSRSKLLKLNN